LISIPWFVTHLDPDLAFEAESEVVSEIAAGDPKNSDTFNDGAPEQITILKIQEILHTKTL